ncbi:MAG: hypothetical protein AAGF95_32920 [Chloroflexota bacterium]
MIREKSRIILRSITVSMLLALFFLPVATSPAAAQGSTLLDIFPINPVTDGAATEIDNNFNQNVVDTAAGNGRINFEARSAVGVDISDDQVLFEIKGFNFNEEILDTTAPFSAFGDTNGDFNGRALTPGVYTITATLCFESSGCIGVPTTTQFVVNNGFGISEIVLVDPATDTDIGRVGTISGSTTPYSIRVETYGDVESVVLTLLGPNPTVNRIENIEPYALFGDTNGDYNGQTSAPGRYSLTVTPYTEDRASGEFGAQFSIPVTVR